MKLEEKLLEEIKKNKFKQMMLDDSEFKIWETLENGCSIATMGYSESNVFILLNLLKSLKNNMEKKLILKQLKKS